MEERRVMSVRSFVEKYNIPVSLPTFRGWIKENKKYLMNEKMIIMYKKGSRNYIKIIDGDRLYTYFIKAGEQCEVRPFGEKVS